MNKNQKIILWGAVGVFAVLVALIIVLIVKNAENTDSANEANAKADSMRAAMLAQQAEAARQAEEDQDQIDYNTFEAYGFDIKNDSILMMYNDLQGNMDFLQGRYDQAQKKIEELNKLLENERKSANADQAKIKQLEAEIATLKDIAKHYLEEMTRLKKENDEIKAENVQQKQQIEDLTRQNETVNMNNAELEKTVEKAKQLAVTSLSVELFKKEGDNKPITKEKKMKTKDVKIIGLKFTVAQNNTAEAGDKTYYVRVITPEGDVLPGGPTFSAGGQELSSSDSTTKPYNNEQSTYEIYYNRGDRTLSPGTYTIELYEGGRNLGRTNFTLVE